VIILKVLLLSSQRLIIKIVLLMVKWKFSCQEQQQFHQWWHPTLKTWWQQLLKV